MRARSGASGTSLDDLCVVGAGARTPAGHTLAASAAAVRAGLVCFEGHPTFRDSDGAAIVVGRASRRPDWAASGAERHVAFAVAAAREALRPIARRSLRGPLSGGIFLALSEPRPGRPDALESVVADAVTRASSRWLGAQQASVSPRGHAAGLVAVEEAVAALGQDEIDVALVGGVDSYLTEETLAWLEEQNRLRRISHPFGLTPAEGAGFCLLAKRRTATRIGVSPDVTIVAIASAKETKHRGTGGISTGEGLTRVLRSTLASLPDERTRVTRTTADLNGEPDRVDEMGFALSRTARSFTSPGDVVVPAATWGDVGAASGPLFVGLAVAHGRRLPMAGIHEVAWCSSDGGARAAVVMRHDAAPTARGR